MLKITIQIVENKNKDTCNVKMITPKDLSKATENEKNCTATIINQITKSLEEIQD